MKLTVMARITGGFSAITLFLLVIGMTGFRSINSINENLDIIVDDIIPMTLVNSELESQLLQANQSLNIYSKTENLDKLASIETLISQNKSNYASYLKEINSMRDDFPSIASPLSELSEISSQYFSEMKSIFVDHQKGLQSKSSKEGIQSNLEDLGDDLDTLVLDFSDETSNRKIKSSLESIGSLVADAVISSIDALNEDALSDVKVSTRELDSDASSLTEKMTALATLNRTTKEKEYFSQLLPLMNQFKVLISGSESLLESYQNEIKSNDKSNAQMSVLNELVSTFLEKSDVLTEVIRLESEQHKITSESDVSSSRWIIIVISLFSIAVAIVLAFWVIRSIRGPLASVNRVLQDVSKGDLTQHITIINDDELGELSGWVNDLVSNLRTIIENIKQNSNKLSEAAENTSVITNQTRSNIQQQRSQTSHILEAMEQMTTAVEEVAQSASSTATEVDKAHQQTTDGTTIVNANIQSITELAEEIDGAAKVINELDEYSRNIDNVLDVIKGIAEQTNLLALNAAIEAARAGEQGRGFAVVADEVRTLASRTQQSTSEIQEMIERLQSGANEAVGVMENSQKKAASSVDDIQKTGELLATITEGISIINDMSTHIATATEQQASVTEEVHTNVDTIANLADETAQGADKTLDSSVLVAELSEQLQASVNHFKI